LSFGKYKLPAYNKHKSIGMNPYKAPSKYTMSNWPPPHEQPTLYRCYWMTASGKVHKGFSKGINGAYNEMSRRLQEGLPSWVKPVPPGEYDDDIPF